MSEHQRREPDDIIQEVMDRYDPVAIYVGFSGGDDSLVTTHWMMNHVPGCQVLHCNTGIGIERTRTYVRETCRQFGWPLTEIRALEDCGQDYEALVREWGFPGPAHHYKMYNRLKDRCFEKALRDNKTRFHDKVAFATGIRHDESVTRAGYAGREINKRRAQIWINPLYWWSGSDFHHYIREHDLPRNPIAEMIGMSGECLCGAYAHRGEKELIRLIDPDVIDRIDRIERLERECAERGFYWGWEEKPPLGSKNGRREFGAPTLDFEGPACFGCGKRR